MKQQMAALSKPKAKALPRIRVASLLAVCEFYLQRYYLSVAPVRSIAPTLERGSDGVGRGSDRAGRRNNIYLLPVSGRKIQPRRTP